MGYVFCCTTDIILGFSSIGLFLSLMFRSVFFAMMVLLSVFLPLFRYKEVETRRSVMGDFNLDVNRLFIDDLNLNIKITVFTLSIIRPKLQFR
jgi:hypothetical protein